MSHLKYTTSAFVVSISALGEADRKALLYTKEFGMISVFAKSVRLLKSKLKHALEEGNFLSVSLVRGREMWRLTDASVEEKISSQSEEFNLFLKIIKLLKSLIHGEEKNEKLFDSIHETFDVLSKKVHPISELDPLECLTVLRILESLGYGRTSSVSSLSVFETISPSLLQSVRANKKEFVALINKSIKESHL